MHLYRDEAIVLRTYRLGEADRIVLLLGREHGPIRAVAKGVRRTTSRFGARLEPFMVVDGQFARGRTLDTVTQVVTKAGYASAIVRDYRLFTAASAIAEAADDLTREDSSPAHYMLLRGALSALAARAHDPRLIVDSYLLRAVSLAGWAPSFGVCSVCGAPGPHSLVSMSAGGAVCEACAPAGSATITPEAMTLLGALLTGDWAGADGSTRTARHEADGVAAAYVQYVLERRVSALALLEAE